MARRSGPRNLITGVICGRQTDTDVWQFAMIALLHHAGSRFPAYSFLSGLVEYSSFPRGRSASIQAVNCSNVRTSELLQFRTLVSTVQILPINSAFAL